MEVQATAGEIQTNGTGSNPQPVSTDSATGSQNGESKLERLYRKNGIDPAGTGAKPNQDPKPVESAKPQETPSQGEPGGAGQQPAESGYDRRVRVLTAREKQANERAKALKIRVKELEAELEKGKSVPKLTEAHFTSKEEFDEYEQNRRMDARLNTDKVKDLQEAIRQEESTAFKAKWQAKIENYYETPQQVAAYRQAIRQIPDGAFTEQVQEFVGHSQMGPVILEYLGINPKVAVQLSGMPATLQTLQLARLEEQLWRHLNTPAEPQQAPSQSSQAPRKQSNAPAPIGPIGANTGTPAPMDGSPDSVRSYKRKLMGL